MASLSVDGLVTVETLEWCPLAWWPVELLWWDLEWCWLWSRFFARDERSIGPPTPELARLAGIRASTAVARTKTKIAARWIRITVSWWHRVSKLVGWPHMLVDRAAVRNPNLSAEIRAVLLGTSLFAALGRRGVLGLELGQHVVEGIGALGRFGPDGCP